MVAKAGNTTVNNPYGRMVLDDYLMRVRAIYAERSKRIMALRTRADAIAYRNEVAKSTAACFGPFPKRTPLNPIRTGITEGKCYQIEKIRFESRPGFWVTANLYVPLKLKTKAPGVLGSCGHAGKGKAAVPYQAYASELAQNGFVVMIIDPLSQGERDQFYTLPEGDTLRINCTHAHNAMAKQLDLVGDFFGNWRVWDAIRALDYMETRDEVDSMRLSMTGNSGGGTITLWMWAIESRLRMIASSCFITSFLNNFENELTQDAEQYPPGVLARGLDMADFLIARAPEAAMVIAQRYCFFDRRGAETAAREVHKLYDLLEEPSRFSFFMGNGNHGYHKDGRSAMRQFFCQHEGIHFSLKSKALELPAPALQVTAQGQVTPAGSLSFQDVFGRKLNQIIARRKQPDAISLKRSLARVLNLKMSNLKAPPSYRVLRPYAVPGQGFTARYAVRIERNVEAILHKTWVNEERSCSLDVEDKIILYVPNLSSALEATEAPFSGISKFTRSCYSVDVRGMGESIPDEAEDFFHPHGMDYMFHGLGLMLNESYIGRRVFDLLRVIALLRHEGALKVSVVGNGHGSILALFATVLDDLISRTELHNYPLTFEKVARDSKPILPASYCPRGILRHLDLPDLYHVFGRRLHLVSQACH